MGDKGSNPRKFLKLKLPTLIQKKKNQ